MSVTAFAKVVSAIVAALQAAPAVCETIYRARPTAVPDQTEQAINVAFQGALPNRGAIKGAPVDWNTRITVELFARSFNESGDVAVDPLLAAVYKRLAIDTTLGGVIDDLEGPGIEAENLAEAQKTGWLRLTYIAQHRTSNLTLD